MKVGTLFSFIFFCIILSAPTVILAQPNNSKPILMIVTEAKFLQLNDGTSHRTGYWLTEFTHPYEEFSKKGYSIKTATPTGKHPTVDPVIDTRGADEKLVFWTNDEEFQSAMALKSKVLDKSKPLDLRTIDRNALSKFSGVFFVGGHGVMEDLLVNLDVQRLLRLADSLRLPVALVCHAPIVLARVANLFPKRSIITAFTDLEETKAHIKKSLLKTTPQQELTNAGFEFVDGGLWAEHVRTLASNSGTKFIVGQNPASARKTALKLIEDIEASRSR